MGRLRVKLKERAERDLKASVITSSTEHLKGSLESIVNTKGTAHTPPCWIKRSSNLKLQLNKKHVPHTIRIWTGPQFYVFWPSCNFKLALRSEGPFHLYIFMTLHGLSPSQRSPLQKLITPLTFSHLPERRKPSQQEGQLTNNSCVVPRGREHSGKRGMALERERDRFDPLSPLLTSLGFSLSGPQFPPLQNGD